MQIRPVTPGDLAKSVIAVPPMARDADLRFHRAENEKIVRHIEAGRVSTLLYGGNANFYHIALSEYESILGQLAEIAAPDTLVIPSVGPAYGTMMDQADILKHTDYPTVMALPQQGLTTSHGIVTGLGHFVEKVGKPIVLYIKHDGFIAIEDARQLVDDGLVSWIKYAIVREDPADDPYLAELLDEVDPKIVVSGIGEQPVVKHLVDFGVNGFTAGCVCIRPDLSHELLEAVQGGNLDRARQIQALFRPLEDLRNAIHPVRVLHEAVALAGIADTGPALPLLSDISEAERALVKKAAATLLEA
ncbi:MAG: dihydrodipicolinate synthase family protein [Verrucomicrobiales bacterium]